MYGDPNSKLAQGLSSKYPNIPSAEAASSAELKELKAQISDIANQVGDLQNSGVDTEARASIAQLESQYSSHLNDYASHKADIAPHAETVNRTITVGVGKDFATIQSAINSIKKRVDATITINVDAGTYAETVSVSGFYGNGSIRIYGPNEVGDTHTVNDIIIKNCNIYVEIRGFKCLSTTTNNVDISFSTYVAINKIKCVGTDASHAGVSISNNSGAYVVGCELSNKKYGIVALAAARVSSVGNSGNGNTIGLYASASTIMKSGAQPTGTTAEGQGSGGIVR